jgi:hypothetical protein
MISTTSAAVCSQMLGQSCVLVVRRRNHVQNPLPYLVKTIQARNPPTLLERVQLIGVRVQHQRGHRHTRIAARRQLRANTDYVTWYGVFATDGALRVSGRGSA